MLKNFLQKTVTWVAEKFSQDPSKMLIVTGVIGWALSSVAQMGAILFNQKISDKEKSFLLPQELTDALVNIASFLIITKCVKYGMTQLYKTGKIAPKLVRDFLQKNSYAYRDKIGKIGFNLDNILKPGTEVFNSYNIHKSLGTTAATVGASIFATNVVTPILRNNMASKAQKNFMELTKPEEKTTIYRQPIQQPIPSYKMYSGDMRI